MSIVARGFGHFGFRRESSVEIRAICPPTFFPLSSTSSSVGGLVYTRPHHRFRRLSHTRKPGPVGLGLETKRRAGAPIRGVSVFRFGLGRWRGAA